MISFECFLNPSNLKATEDAKVQKQPPEVLCKKRCSWKFRKIPIETPVSETLF